MYPRGISKSYKYYFKVSDGKEFNAAVELPDLDKSGFSRARLYRETFTSWDTSQTRNTWRQGTGGRQMGTVVRWLYHLFVV